MQETIDFVLFFQGQQYRMFTFVCTCFNTEFNLFLENLCYRFILYIYENHILSVFRDN